ncbi:MAG: HAMP domain-containing histidine kinase [Planctomycetales bacterium]|nr:HAMP domain-containing histidine kinase [Planctomycetales bacterium]
MKKIPTSIAILGIVIAWITFAEWQRREFVHQRKSLQESVERQAKSMVSAIASIVESHRWFGPFVQNELNSALQRIARSADVLAVAIMQTDSRDKRIFGAGDAKLLDLSVATDGLWTTDGFAIGHPFQMTTSPPNRGMGFGGLGHVDHELFDGRFVHSSPANDQLGDFKAVLLLDRSGVDQQIQRELRNRVLLVAFGGLVLACTAVAWTTTVRLAEARGTARLLKAESHHFQQLGQAAAGLAHETRNPLGIIRGWAQRLVSAGLPTDEQQFQAEAMVEECDRVTARINQFLAFARPPELQIETTSVREVIEQLLLALEPDLDDRSIVVDIEHVGRENIQADREQLRQAVFNLLLNAVQFSPDGGTITMRFSPQPTRGEFRLEVADQGPGPPPESIGKLFEPYVTSRPEGTGLGLAIVQRIATAHGWNVGCSKRENGGSVFWIDSMAASRKGA